MCETVSSPTEPPHRVVGETNTKFRKQAKPRIRPVTCDEEGGKEITCELSQEEGWDRRQDEKRTSRQSKPRKEMEAGTR